MRSIAFGLERIAWVALKWPRVAIVGLLVVIALAAFGLTRVSFDEDVRNTFASSSDAFRDYVAATADFVDPENETLILVEGDRLGDADNMRRLADLQLQLPLLDGIDSVYSPFALREAPDADGNAPLVLPDDGQALTPELTQRVRAHPILGSKLLSADGKAMVFVVTPSKAKAPLSVSRQLNDEIQAAIDEILAGSGLTATLTGFPAIRIGIVDVLKRDQIVLNAIGAFVGFLISLLTFRSVVAAVLTAGPAIIAGVVVLGGMGLFNAPVTVMSTVIPALVMILGYADGLHLSHAWRKHREAGKSPLEAEWLAQKEAGAACMLTALTVAAAFASLAITRVDIIWSFAWVGAAAMLVACPIMLIGHSLGAIYLGRLWKPKGRTALDLLTRSEEPCAALGRFVVRNARALSLISAALFFICGAMYWAVPPQHSLREHLPANNAANAALGRYDARFGGAFPLEVVVPGPTAATAAITPEGLARLGAVHEAVANITGEPLSLWSLVKWLGGGADATTVERLETVLGTMSVETRSRFVSPHGAMLVMASVQEQPVHVMEPLMEKVEAAATAAGGPGVALTGVTVMTSREAAAAINDLNWSLATAVFGDVLLLVLAFRNIPIGVVSSLANTLPLFATGTLLFLSGHGMQFSSVIALTVAFGIAVDDTVHYINRLLVLHGPEMPLGERIVETSREVGPVLIGTTVIILFGLSTTFASGLPTVTLFGVIAGITLVVAMTGDLVVMPALMAGYASRWFEPRTAPKGETASVAVGGSSS